MTAVAHQECDVRPDTSRFSCTGARKGNDFIERLSALEPNLWYKGERVRQATSHPAFRNVVSSLSELYDLQHREAAVMLYPSPSSGRLINRSFQVPTTVEELCSITRSMKAACDFSLGMMGRSPDYMNRSLTAFASAAPYLATSSREFDANILKYYEFVRENDLCLTHTLITPQANRGVGTSSQADPFLAARVKKETDSGIIISGARMLATLPIADEIMVFPSTLLKNQNEDAPYAFGFSISTGTAGLKFLCRESADYGTSRFDHPLSSRFDEMDAVVIFEDVFVPWERVFLYRDVHQCNQAYIRTGALASMAHHATVKAVSKTEYLLGLVGLMTEYIGVQSFQHIQEKISEIWVNLEIMKACLRAAEVEAKVNEWGVLTPAFNPLDAARNLYPKMYPRMIEIIQLVGASGLVGLPTWEDTQGPMKSDVAKYFQAAHANSAQRVPLFKLAWDTAISSFGSRQLLYERFFFGDPVRMAGAVCSNHAEEMEGYKNRLKRRLEVEFSS